MILKIFREDPFEDCKLGSAGRRSRKPQSPACSRSRDRRKIADVQRILAVNSIALTKDVAARKRAG
jgi:hypothetical protein